VEYLMTLELSFVTLPDDLPPLFTELRHDPDTATVRMIVSGDVDALTVPELRTAFVDAARLYQPSRIEGDCRGVTFLDSVGIRTLLQCRADAGHVDCDITLINTPPIVYRVLEITGLLDHFRVKEPYQPDGSQGARP